MDGRVTYMKDPSHVPRTIQLKPSINKNPKFRLRCHGFQLPFWLYRAS